MLKKTALTLSLSCLLVAATPLLSSAHCQLPCGIYDDTTRFALLHEDIATIEKAIDKITALEASGKNSNQLVRWINTKERHAENIQEMASAYFLAQRIKFNCPEYDKKLAALHQIIVYAMKCKQKKEPNPQRIRLFFLQTLSARQWALSSAIKELSIKRSPRMKPTPTTPKPASTTPHSAGVGV